MYSNNNISFPRSLIDSSYILTKYNTCISNNKYKMYTHTHTHTHTCTCIWYYYDMLGVSWGPREEDMHIIHSITLHPLLCHLPTTRGSNCSGDGDGWWCYQAHRGGWWGGMVWVVATYESMCVDTQPTTLNMDGNIIITMIHAIITISHQSYTWWFRIDRPHPSLLSILHHHFARKETCYGKERYSKEITQEVWVILIECRCFHQNRAVTITCLLFVGYEEFMGWVVIVIPS